MSGKEKVIIVCSAIGIFIALLGGSFFFGYRTATRKYEQRIAEIQRTADEYKRASESARESLDGLGRSIRTTIDNITTAQGLADKSSTLTDRIRIISKGFKEAVRGLKEALQLIPDSSGGNNTEPSS